MDDLPKCSVDGCEKKARSFKGGYCQMHYTRERTHGDVNINLYADKGQKWELPDGTIIREAKKIENLKIIIDRIKNKRLLGYQTNNDDTLDIIEKVLDDYHGKYKSGQIKRGAKTLLYEEHVDVLAKSDWGFENGLITMVQANLISKVVSELSKSENPIKFLDICNDVGIESNDTEWLIKAFTKYPIIGITYNPEEKTVQFSKDLNWFYKEFNDKSEHTINELINTGFHNRRRDSYKQHELFMCDRVPYSVLVMCDVPNVIKYLIENGETEENTLYEKCDTNQIMLQQMIDNDIGIIKNNGIVKFSLVPKIQELIKKDKQMRDDYTDKSLAYNEILDNLGINYVEYATLEAVKKNYPESA